MIQKLVVIKQDIWTRVISVYMVIQDPFPASSTIVTVLPSPIASKLLPLDQANQELEFSIKTQIPKPGGPLVCILVVTM